MKYMGSKAKYAKDILKSIQNEITGFEPLLTCKYHRWVEPFVGGANMIEIVPKVFRPIGNDINVHLIELFKALQNGWKMPLEVTREQYAELMKKSDILLSSIESPLIGFAGIACSYSGKWFGGFAGKTKTKIGTVRDYQAEARKNIEKQNIKGIVFTSGNYKEMVIPNNSIIYCDPPYADTTRYQNNFNHDDFWKWCDEQLNKGNKIFVSEYNAPEGWRCIWSKEVKSSLSANGKIGGSKKSIEKLFTK